jgi:hypothetical protein
VGEGVAVSRDDREAAARSVEEKSEERRVRTETLTSPFYSWSRLWAWSGPSGPRPFFRRRAL